MKILYVTTISDTVNSFLIPHIRFLIKMGHEVGVAFNIIQEVDRELTELRCTIHQVDFQRNPLSKDNVRAYREIKNILLEEGYELVHVHTPVASFITRLACRGLNVKVLYTAHGFHFFNGAPKRNWMIYYPLEKLAAKWTDGVITMNDEDYHAAKRLKIRSEASIYKIHGVGLDLAKFSPKTAEEKADLREKHHFSKDDFIVIYVAELCYRKQQDLLIKAVSMVKEEVVNIKLLLAGDGDMLQAYQKQVTELRLEENVFFLGYRDDIDQLLTMSDVAISTSRQEGLPVNVMEAMATGIPLIVTDCRGNRDLVKDGENGIVIGINDVNGCAQAILDLYRAEELRQQFSDNSRSLIQQYSLENVIKDMKVVYSKQTSSY
ncbi:glycosyltransferase family 4 protein [Bacillus rubiinfantis]|uniref:glycosyltransferase family 4 protein n=1 Tax=Bacillus rubiinfantis TaxID=1499680 RepID=UPI0005A8A322|nr:glycosyltransferase family 4 protein [Bacillus rubiinfantis]